MHVVFGEEIDGDCEIKCKLVLKLAIDGAVHSQVLVMISKD